MFNRGDKVRDTKYERIYDYGHQNVNGDHICYEEGECNMQDAVCIPKHGLELVQTKEEVYAKTVEGRLEALEKQVAYLERTMFSVDG
jgi:PHD/YefM family antitoxin component YafN of YafNO toxin-antitoxin module